MAKRVQAAGQNSYGHAFKRQNIAIGKKSPPPKFVPINANPNLNLQELERTLAKEYHDKPRAERESLVNEFHGVSSRAIPETPELIRSSLNAFQRAIDNMVPAHEKGAYYKACSMNSTYVQSSEFRIKFLRAELFDVKNAALRYVRNLDYLLEAFGEFALMRQLYLSDLTKEEMNFFKKGYTQVLPFRDSVGRRIMVNLGSYGGVDFSMRAKERVGIFVLFAILADDQTTQRKGAISVGMISEDAIEGLRGVSVSSIRRMNQAMPIRFTGYHTCVPDTLGSRILKALALTFFMGDVRLMSRFHIGTQIEREYELRTFGIPTECIPLSCTGTIKDGYHRTYLKMRTKMDDHRKSEANSDDRLYYSASFPRRPFYAIECPEIDSFLVRRNGVAWNYPGNVRVRSILEDKLNNQKRLKEEYVRAVTEELIERDISILGFDDMNGWYTRIARKQDIQKQVLYIMREIRKRKRLKEKASSQSNACNSKVFQKMTDRQCSPVPSCFGLTSSMDVSMEQPMDQPMEQ